MRQEWKDPAAVALEDERPIVVCRLDCPPEAQGQLDDWMPKHFDDSLAHPHWEAAASYRIVRDWEALPSPFNHQGDRFVVYAARNRDDIIDWLAGPHSNDAIEDGAERERQYPLLDDEPFNGVIYDVSEVREAIRSEFAGTNSIIVELFDVPKMLQAEFDGWLSGNHLDAFASLPGVVRVRTWMQRKDDVPAQFPYSRYVGKGNRMIWSDLEPDLDVRRFLANQRVLDTVTDSMSWDLRLPYVRRDACEHLLTRRPGDAN